MTISYNELLSKVESLRNSEPRVVVVNYEWTPTEAILETVDADRQHRIQRFTPVGVRLEHRGTYRAAFDDESLDKPQRGRGSLKGVKRGAYRR